MSAPQEFMFTAQPEMPQCQGENCYCFFGRNQMDATFSDDESSKANSEPPIQIYHGDDEWQILEKEPDWAISLLQTKFRHPRVLLAYFRFINLHNEIANEEERMNVPEIPTHVVDFIFQHISIREPPAEFKNEIEELKMHVLAWKER